MSQPLITTLHPTVLDARRVSLEIQVANLPTLGPNVTLTIPQAQPDEYTPSIYPNLNLTIWDATSREVAGLFIVEHQEPQLNLTLHLRGAMAVNPLVARAELLQGETVLQTVEVPFTLEFPDQPLYP